MYLETTVAFSCVQAQGRVWNWEHQADKWVGRQAGRQAVKADLDGQV